MEAKIYEPWPDGQVPDGWPKEYVSLDDYKRLKKLVPGASRYADAWVSFGDDGTPNLAWGRWPPPEPNDVVVWHPLYRGPENGSTYDYAPPTEPVKKVKP